MEHNPAGECHLHTVEVTGSIPVTPTNNKAALDLEAAFLLLTSNNPLIIWYTSVELAEYQIKEFNYVSYRNIVFYRNCINVGICIHNLSGYHQMANG